METCRARRSSPGVFFVCSASVATLLLALPACRHAPPLPGAVTLEGRISDASITEASGLARSRSTANLFWLIEDGGGGPVLHAMRRDGHIENRITVAQSRNIDWEDLASFEHHGAPYLLIADTGDNHARRDYVSLYLLVEPDMHEATVEPLRRIDFRYPRGPRDAEAVAVDPRSGDALIMTKRDLPAALYSVPLFGEASERVLTARFEALASGLDAPTESELRLAPARNDWFWQPTAMDLSDDGRDLVVLTYAAVFLFDRSSTNWSETLQQATGRVPIRPIRDAESISFDGGGLRFTVEASRAPVFGLRRALFAN